MKSLVYLHGFADGPGDVKGEYCRSWAEERGVKFYGPDLNLPTFESLTISAQFAAVKALVEELRSGVVLVGSSLGGLVAAAVASAASQRSQVQALVLLAPAFGFARRRLDAEDWAGYRRTGRLLVWHATRDCVLRLGPQLLEDLLAWRSDDQWLVDVDVIVLHGLSDDVVPIEESQAFVGRQGNARLITQMDGHGLAAPSSMSALRTILEQTLKG